MPRLGVAIVHQYERGVIFRLGKVRNVRDPGIRFMIPLVDVMRKVSLRTVTMPIQSQQIITKDNVSIGVAAVAYFRRVDAVKSTVEIEDVQSAIYQIAQTTVRNIVGRSSLDQVLSETETLNQSIREVLDVTTERWGVLVELVELKDIELPQSMQRAMAREAEAERESAARSSRRRARRSASASWPRPRMSSRVIPSRCNYGTCRSLPRSPSRRTPRSSFRPSSCTASVPCSSSSRTKTPWRPGPGGMDDDARTVRS
jgi:regulator of protease activity HflC (stomatin/prohibitin superfamily)